MQKTANCLIDQDADVKDLTCQKFGANGAAASGKIVVTGSKGANAALTSLLAALVTLGLVTDTTT